MNEYVRINKTAILKRIEELEEKSKHNELVGEYDMEGEIISELKQILSQSTPLIPEIEKAYDVGSYNHHSQHTEKYDTLKQLHISNLKLDI